MRLVVPTLSLAAAVSLAVPALAGTKVVKVGDDFFGRPGGVTVTVSKGTKVTWRWTGQHPHTVTVRRGPVKFKSPIGGGRGFSYSHKMTRRGTYRIICEFHGAAAMHMTLKVR